MVTHHEQTVFRENEQQVRGLKPKMATVRWVGRHGRVGGAQLTGGLLGLLSVDSRRREGAQEALSGAERGLRIECRQGEQGFRPRGRPSLGFADACTKLYSIRAPERDSCEE